MRNLVEVGVAFLLVALMILACVEFAFARKEAAQHPSAEHVLKCILIEKGEIRVPIRLTNETQHYSLSIGQSGDEYVLKVTR